VTFQGVSKRYGEVLAVDNLTLEINDGEFMVLVGPSGCGKTTSLRMIAGLEEITDGTLLIGNKVVNDIAPKDRDIAMVFQSYALYPHMTVEKNIAFPLVNARQPRKLIDERVRETAERLAIAHLLDRKPRELSGGQRQRVALGRALVRRPKAFLFDEPLSNLDAALRTQMRAELKKLHEELHATFVYVTHDQAEAMTLSDRVVVLEAGVLQQVGAARTIYERPANVFVATFFGSPRVNLVPARTLGVLAARAPREGALLGLRPENVQVGVGPAPGGAVSGEVYLVEPMGAETFVTVSVDGERITARAQADFDAGTGAPAWLRPDLAHAMWFDPATQRRIEV
jgi:multiple sugar transport system ATP-binding protein